MSLFSSSAAGLDSFTRGSNSKPQNDDPAPPSQEAVVDENAKEITITNNIRVPNNNKNNNDNHDNRRNHNNSAIVQQFFARHGDAESSQQLLQLVKQMAANQTDFLVATRRTLHQTPELMFQEEQTSAAVQDVLQQLGISFTTGWSVNTNPHVYPGPGGYGVVADIGTGEAPCVLLRADMDALPIREQTAVDFRSQRDNCMHACGHDGHTTMLLGAAAILQSVRDAIPGTVRLVFQPAEEGGAGAKRMREEGVLDMEPKPQHAFGMHLWPTLPSGTIAGRPGPLLAAAERFEIVVQGVGGHAAMPHLTVDPVVTASAMVMNLQTIVSRSISPLQAGVCTISKIESGEGAFNVIPSSALLRGTVRALSTETLLQLRDRVQHIVDFTAATYGCNATIT